MLIALVDVGYNLVELVRMVCQAQRACVRRRRSGRRGAALAAYLRAVRFGDRRRSTGSILRTLTERQPYVDPWPPPGPEPGWLKTLREAPQRP